MRLHIRHECVFAGACKKRIMHNLDEPDYAGHQPCATSIQNQKYIKHSFNLNVLSEHAMNLCLGDARDGAPSTLFKKC